MPIKILAANILTLLCIVLNAQVYHQETGKIIPTQKPDSVIWSSGVFNYYYADFGTLIAKENRTKRDSRLITIPVIRVKAYDIDSVSYPIFVLNGGPGETNLNSELINNRLLKHHDFVFVGYRGVDGSGRLECPSLSTSFDLYRANATNLQHHIPNAFDSCLTFLHKKGIDPLGYTTTEVINDMNVVKNALGYDSIAIMGFSYGSMLAQQYYYTHSESVVKMLLIGARPMGDFNFYPDIFKDQIGKIYNYYFKDTTDAMFKNYLEFLKTVKYIVSALDELPNNDPLYLYLFSQLYTNQNIERTFSKLKKSVFENNRDFITDLQMFYKNYPGDLVLADMYLKKQAWLGNNKKTQGIGLPYEICNAMNTYFNPYHEFFVNENMQKDTAISIYKPVMLLSGEIDVAAPPALIEEKLNPYLLDLQYFVVEKAGHLNLVIDRSDLINRKIELFFNSVN